MEYQPPGRESLSNYASISFVPFRRGANARLVVFNIRLCLVLFIGLTVFLGCGTSARAIGGCPNEEFRTGPSANLPDCRAYELVSPADTGGIRPTAANTTNIPHAFESSLISATGNSAVFQSIQGALSGSDGNGHNDRYLATRGPSGWTTTPLGPTAVQTEDPWPGGLTSEHDYAFFHAGGACLGNDRGSLITEFGAGQSCADFLRKPDGSYELIGRGSLADDHRTEGFYISAGGDHIIFSTTRGTSPEPDEAIQLEPNAPPTGTNALYDRSADGPTHVVSLLPGNITPVAGENGIFAGASADGSVVAFKIGTDSANLQVADPASPLYVRVDNAQTYEVSPNPNTFAGVSANGEYVFYANATSGNGVSENSGQTPADLFSFDTATQTTTQITNTGDSRFVNVAADGSRVYFVSPSQIEGKGVVGEPNFYLWDRASGTTSFIATLSAADAATEFITPSLVGWTQFATAPIKTELNGTGDSLSRTTPDGSVIIFESKAQLTSYDNEAHTEIYRYDANTNTLDCVSCGPGEGPATSDASLQSFNAGNIDLIHPLTAVQPPANLTLDGGTVFFQTAEALLPVDTNERQDVYRWKNGQIALISSGQATKDSFLYATTPDGSDVLFITPQQLLPQDRNGATGSLYDARVDGGFPVGVIGSKPCIGDACQVSSSPPDDIQIGSSTFFGSGNRSLAKRKRCGRHRRLRKGRCVMRKHHHHSRKKGGKR